MKKLLLMLALTCLSTMSFSQSTGGSINDFQKKLDSATEKAAKSLEVPAERLFDYVSIDKRVKGITAVSTMLVYYILSFLFFYKMSEYIQEKEIDERERDKRIESVHFPAIILSIISFFFSVYVINYLPNALSMAINPEYWAIEEIMNYLK